MKRGIGQAHWHMKGRRHPVVSESQADPLTPIPRDRNNRAHHARGQEDTRAPTHTDVGGYVWTQDGRDDFTCVCSGQGLVSAGSLDRLTWKTPQGTPQMNSEKARRGSEVANTGPKIAKSIQAIPVVSVTQPSPTHQPCTSSSIRSGLVPSR